MLCMNVVKTTLHYIKKSLLLKALLLIYVSPWLIWFKSLFIIATQFVQRNRKPDCRYQPLWNSKGFYHQYKTLRLYNEVHFNQSHFSWCRFFKEANLIVLLGDEFNQSASFQNLCECLIKSSLTVVLCIDIPFLATNQNSCHEAIVDLLNSFVKLNNEIRFTVQFVCFTHRLAYLVQRLHMNVSISNAVLKSPLLFQLRNENDNALLIHKVIHAIFDISFFYIFGFDLNCFLFLPENHHLLYQRHYPSLKIMFLTHLQNNSVNTKQQTLLSGAVTISTDSTFYVPFHEQKTAECVSFQILKRIKQSTKQTLK